MSAWQAFAVAALTTAVVTPLLARVARAAGLVDDARAAPERKLQRVAVPPVGGPALLAGLVVARLVAGAPFAWPATSPAAEPWWWAALTVAFATGLVDDVLPRGLRPGAKLVGQAVAGALLAFALAPTLGRGPAAALACVLAAVLAQNLVNTWDNADGAATASGLLGTVPSEPASAGALLAFLPFNLSARGAARVPTAYLGDSGSHLVGLLMMASPWSWPALAPPAFDLARVCLARARVGVRPWHGDRRHLAHRLQEAGLGPRAVVLVLVLVTLPGLVPAWVRQAAGAPPALDAWQACGLAGSLAAWGLCVAWTLEPAHTPSAADRG